MFAYLRYFSAISFVLVVIAAYIVGAVFKNIASEDLHTIVRANNAALAQGFINSVWKRHANSIERLSKLPRIRWRNDIEFVTFSREAFKFFEDMPIAKMTIYTKDGVALFSSDQSKLLYVTDGIESGEGIYGFENAQAGNSVSRIITDAGFDAPSGQQVSGTLIHIVQPIITASYSGIVAGTTPPVEGIIEILYDVTPQWERLIIFQIVTTAGIILIFTILIGLLILTSRRAENIIAKQHEVNLELTAAAATAEAENRDKSQFLANISHELRTPLNAIIGFSEIIKTVGAPNMSEDHRDYIRDIHASGVHLLSLINDILDYSKAEAGKLEVDLTETDVSKIIKNSMRLVIPRAEEAQVTLVEDIPAQHVVMDTDGKKLKQVLLNLLSNAVKFTPAGGEVRVSIWINVVDDNVIIQVQDTGIGVAPKDISRIMTPFGQIDSTMARKYEGTGLGLPLSKKFVEIMGGKFQIESEVGVGTTITLYLPRTDTKNNATSHGSL